MVVSVEIKRVLLQLDGFSSHIVIRVKGQNDYRLIQFVSEKKQLLRQIGSEWGYLQMGA